MEATATYTLRLLFFPKSQIDHSTLLPTFHCRDGPHSSACTVAKSNKLSPLRQTTRPYGGYPLAASSLAAPIPDDVLIPSIGHLALVNIPPPTRPVSPDVRNAPNKADPVHTIF